MDNPTVRELRSYGAARLAFTGAIWMALGIIVVVKNTSASLLSI